MAEAPNAAGPGTRPWADLIDMPNDATTPEPVDTDTQEPTETPEPDTQETAPEPETTVPESAPGLDEEETQRGYLRQSDYTRKTQDLARERKALEDERRRIQAEAAELQDTRSLVNLMRENPEWTRDILTSAQERGIAMPQERGAMPPEMTEAINRAKTAAGQLELQVLGNTILSERDRIARELKFSPEDARKVVLEAFEDGLIEPGMDISKVGRRLEKAFKAASADRAHARGQRELKDKLQAGTRAASVGARAIAPKAPERTGPVGWDRATDAAIEAYRKARSG